MGKSVKKFDVTNEKIYVGQISNGWIMIHEYPNHNLWVNKNGIRESFFKNQLPRNVSIFLEE